MRACYFIHDGGSAFVQNDPPDGKPAARNRLCLQVGNSIGQEAGPLLRRKVLVVQVASLSPSPYLSQPFCRILLHCTARTSHGYFMRQPLEGDASIPCSLPSLR